MSNLHPIKTLTGWRVKNVEFYTLEGAESYISTMKLFNRKPLGMRSSNSLNLDPHEQKDLDDRTASLQEGSEAD